MLFNIKIHTALGYYPNKNRDERKMMAKREAMKRVGVIND